MNEGEITARELMYLKMEGFCNEYGWTPEEYLRQDPFIIEAFTAILTGRSEKDQQRMNKKTMKKLL